MRATFKIFHSKRAANEKQQIFRLKKRKTLHNQIHSDHKLAEQTRKKIPTPEFPFIPSKKKTQRKFIFTHCLCWLRRIELPFYNSLRRNSIWEKVSGSTDQQLAK